MYEYLTIAHLTSAALTILGFVLRGYWMFRESNSLHHPLTRVLPHVVDTVFLVSGIGLVIVLQFPIMSQPWLLAKLVALVAYIVFGAIALRRGRNRRTRMFAFVAALLTFAYIVGVAINRSPMSWLNGVLDL